MGAHWQQFLIFAVAGAVLAASLLFLFWSDHRALVRQGGTRQELKDIAGRLDKESAERIEAEAQLRPLKENDQHIRDSLADMKRVWLGDYDHRDEAECQAILARNLWVLSPDYIIDWNTFIELPYTTLSEIFGKHFPDAKKKWNEFEFKAFIDGKRRPDMCGFAETASAISPGRHQRDKVYLIVELKAANVDLSWKELEQAHAYAFGLFQNIGDDLRKAHVSSIDCLVIGRDASKVSDAHLRWGPNAHDAIRIIPISYKQLYDRAERLAKLLMRESYARRNKAFSAERRGAQPVFVTPR